MATEEALSLARFILGHNPHIEAVTTEDELATSIDEWAEDQ